MSVFEMPSPLYMITATVITVTYGKPSARYSEGIHAHGWRATELGLVEDTNSFSNKAVGRASSTANHSWQALRRRPAVDATELPQGLPGITDEIQNKITVKLLFAAVTY